jgi:hypothetical protein
MVKQLMVNNTSSLLSNTIIGGMGQIL